MKFNRYDNLDAFRADALDVLLSDEVRNNLPISIVSDKTPKNTSDWLMGTVTSDSGEIMLIALRTPPFNMLLYTSGEAARNGGSPGPGAYASAVRDAVRFLAAELLRNGQRLPGVTAESEYAGLFTGDYTHGSGGISTRPMVIMRLDELLPYDRAPGICRVLTEDDLPFVTTWEQAFCVDCHVPSSPFDEKMEQIRTRLGRDLHYIWEDGLPVSQAVFGRETPNGAVVSWVYTPPLYRGRGYATSVVGELSKSLLGHRKRFCCLYADAGNPISRGIYSKLGYYDVCEFTEIEFGSDRR